MRKKFFQIKKKSLALSWATFCSHNWKAISYRSVQNGLAGRMFENFKMEKANLHCFKSFHIFKELIVCFITIKSAITLCPARKRTGDN